MYRLMQPEDKPAVLALWQSQRNESEEFAKKAIEQFAGEQNVYVAEENDEIAAVALAVPVTLQGRSVGITLWAEREETSKLLRGASSGLEAALADAQFENGTIDIHTGQPRVAQPTAGQFLDRMS